MGARARLPRGEGARRGETGIRPRDRVLHLRAIRVLQGVGLFEEQGQRARRQHHRRPAFLCRHRERGRLDAQGGVPPRREGASQSRRGSPARCVRRKGTDLGQLPLRLRRDEKERLQVVETAHLPLPQNVRRAETGSFPRILQLLCNPRRGQGHRRQRGVEVRPRAGAYRPHAQGQPRGAFHRGGSRSHRPGLPQVHRRDGHPHHAGVPVRVRRHAERAPSLFL